MITAKDFLQHLYKNLQSLPTSGVPASEAQARCDINMAYLAAYHKLFQIMQERGSNLPCVLRDEEALKNIEWFRESKDAAIREKATHLKQVFKKQMEARYDIASDIGASDYKDILKLVDLVFR